MTAQRNNILPPRQTGNVKNKQNCKTNQLLKRSLIAVAQEQLKYIYNT